MDKCAQSTPPNTTSPLFILCTTTLSNMPVSPSRRQGSVCPCLGRHALSLLQTRTHAHVHHQGTKNTTQETAACWYRIYAPDWLRPCLTTLIFHLLLILIFHVVGRLR